MLKLLLKRYYNTAGTYLYTTHENKNYYFSESSGFTLVHNNSNVFYCYCFAVHTIDREHRHDDSRFGYDRQNDI